MTTAFSSEVTNKLVNEIQKNGWDQNLHNLYQWPLKEQLDQLINICVSVPDWLRDLSNNPLNASKDQTSRMTLTLRDNMPAMLEGNSEKTDKIKIWIVRNWGGIQRGDEKGLLDCIRQAECEHGLDVKSSTRNKSGKREFTFERIASWSKYLAFKFPQQYAIYDARVIYSLNWLLLNVGGKKYLPFLEGQNSVMGLLNYNLHLLLSHHGGARLCEELKSDIENRKNDPSKKSRLQSKLEKGLFIRKQEAYSEYCDLLDVLAKAIYPDKDGVTDTHRLTKIEMILFSIADKAIATEVMNSFTGKISASHS